jgi:hypothetical protein
MIECPERGHLPSRYGNHLRRPGGTRTDMHASWLLGIQLWIRAERGVQLGQSRQSLARAPRTVLPSSTIIGAAASAGSPAPGRAPARRTQPPQDRALRVAVVFVSARSFPVHASGSAPYGRHLPAADGGRVRLRPPGRTGDISSKPDICLAPCGCCRGGPPRCRAGTRRTGRCGRAHGRRSPSRMLAIGACTERAQLPGYAAA